MEPAIPSLRAVLQWTLDKGRTDLALELAARGRHCFQFAGRNTDALAFLEAGLSLPDASDELRMMALIEEARCRILLGDFSKSLVSLREALSLADVVDNPAMVAEALCVLGLLANARLRFRASNRFLNRALAILQSNNLMQLQPELMALLGVNALERKDLIEARDWFAKARTKADDLDDRWQLALALHHLGMTEFDLNGPEWPAFFEASIENFRAEGDRQGESWVLSSMADRMLWCGQTGAAREAIDRSLRIRRAARDRGGIMESLRILSLIDAEEGNYAAARTNLVQAYRMCYESGWTMALCETLELMAIVEFRANNFAQAVLLTACAQHLRDGRQTPSTARQGQYAVDIKRIEALGSQPEMLSHWEQGSRMSSRDTLNALQGA